VLVRPCVGYCHGGSDGALPQCPAKPDSFEPALDPAQRLLRDGTQIPPIEYCMTDQTTVLNAFWRDAHRLMSVVGPTRTSGEIALTFAVRGKADPFAQSERFSV
jgi:hypothetical protein